MKSIASPIRLASILAPNATEDQLGEASWEAPVCLMYRAIARIERRTLKDLPCPEWPMDFANQTDWEESGIWEAEGRAARLIADAVLF